LSPRPSISETLLEQYHEACNVEGRSLEDFIEAAKGEHTSHALGLLLEKVEADILENISLMAGEHSGLREAADQRFRLQRERIAALRAVLDQ